MDVFDKMITTNLLPPYATVYLISDNNIVTLNKEDNNCKHIHPEIHLFNLTDLDYLNINKLRDELLSITSYGSNSVLAIFQDKSFKTFVNLNTDFIPSILNK